MPLRLPESAAQLVTGFGAFTVVRQGVSAADTGNSGELSGGGQPETGRALVVDAVTDIIVY